MAIDIFNIKPNVVTRDLSGKSFFIYGERKSGKTTNACKFPKPILLAFEKGYNAIPGIMVQPLNSWAEFRKTLRELKKEEVKETDNNDLLSVGDIVTYNGGSSAIADIGAPEGLVVGQEDKVEKVVIYKGLSYAKLEGVDKLVDIICLDKVMKKDIEEPTKEDDKKTEEEKNTDEMKVGEAVPFKIEEINEEPEKKNEEPKEEPTTKVEEKPAEASDNSEKTDDENFSKIL